MSFRSRKRLSTKKPPEKDGVEDDDTVEFLEDLIDKSLEGGKKLSEEKKEITSIPGTQLLERCSGFFEGTVKACLCLMTSGIPIFSLKIDEDSQDGPIGQIGNIDPVLLSGVTSAIHQVMRQSTSQKIRKLELESDLLVFENRGDIIVAVLSDNTVSDDILDHIVGNVLSHVEANVDVTKPIKLNAPEFRQCIEDSKDIILETLVEERNKERRQMKSRVLKIVLIGDGAVGKTAIRNRYMGKGFEQEYLMTIGCDFSLKETRLKSGQICKWQIWDLAGQPRFSAVNEAYFGGSFGALVIFDVTRPETFKNIARWIAQLWKSSGSGPVPLVIVGNKSDLRTNLKDSGIPVIHDEQANLFADFFTKETEKTKNFCVRYVPTSAKTGDNIEQAFDILGTNIFSWFEAEGAKKHSS